MPVFMNQLIALNSLGEPQPQALVGWEGQNGQIIFCSKEREFLGIF
jgi:hypothetical protein